MYTPQHPRLPCDKQAGAVQFESFDGRTPNRRFADDVQSTILPSEVRVPPLSARVEKRDDFASLGVRNFGFIAFKRVANVAAEGQVRQIVTPTFGARNDVVNCELLAHDTLL